MHEPSVVMIEHVLVVRRSTRRAAPSPRRCEVGVVEEERRLAGRARRGAQALEPRVVGDAGLAATLQLRPLVDRLAAQAEQVARLA